MHAFFTHLGNSVCNSSIGKLKLFIHVPEYIQKASWLQFTKRRIFSREKIWGIHAVLESKGLVTSLANYKKSANHLSFIPDWANISEDPTEIETYETDLFCDGKLKWCIFTIINDDKIYIEVYSKPPEEVYLI